MRLLACVLLPRRHAHCYELGVYDLGACHSLGCCHVGNTLSKDTKKGLATASSLKINGVGT